MSPFNLRPVDGREYELLVEASRLCLSTTVMAFVFGNLLLLSTDSLAASLPILLVVLLVQASLFQLWHLSGNLGLGMLLVFAALAGSVFVDVTYLRWILLLAALLLMPGYARVILQAGGDRRTGLLLKLSLLCAVVVISAKSPASFDMIQRLELGLVHRDTLFHASIAAMLKQYGVVSTGLNGLIETPYHVLSHSIIASISKLTGVGVLESYGIVPLLLFLPLLISLYAFLASSLNPSLSYLRSGFFTALVLAITPRVFKLWGLKESYFGSESFMLSLLLFCAVLPMLVRPMRNRSDVLVMSGLTAMIAAAKATVGVAVVGLYLSRLVFIGRREQDWPRQLFLLICMSVLVVLVVLPSVRGNVGGADVLWWEYVRLYSMLGGWFEHGIFAAIIPVMLFAVFHFILNWAVIVSRSGGIDGQAIWQDPAIILNLMAVCGGVLIVMLPLVGGSSAYYFSGAAMFVALPWIVAILAQRDYRRIGHPFVVALVVVLLFKGGKLLDKSILRRDAATDPVQVELVGRLLAMRGLHDDRTVYRRIPADAPHTSNPVADCNFRPFVYPAVSEKAWTGLLQDSCKYYQYGYSHYFIQGAAGTARVEARLPADHRLVDIPVSGL